MKFLKLWDLSGNSERTMSKGLLTKNEHFGANCLWDVSRLYSENSIQTLLIFWGVDPKKFRRVCMEFSKHNWATISETVCPEMLIFGKSHNFRNFIFMTSSLYYSIGLSQNVSRNCFRDHCWGRRSTIGQYFSLSLVTVPQFFVKVNSAEFPSSF